MKIINKFGEDLNETSWLPDQHTTIIGMLSEIDINITVLYDIQDSLLVEKDPESCSKLNVDLVIVSLADHNWCYIKDNAWWQNLTQVQIPVIVLNSFITGNSNEIFCPIYAIMYGRNLNRVTKISPKIPSLIQAKDPVRKYIISSLSNRPRIERILNLIEIEKRWPDCSLVSMALFCEGVVDLKTVQDRTSTDDYEFFINNIFNRLPIRIDLDNSYLFDCDNLAYYDSYVNIVTEYGFYADTPFFSEKTIKPLLSGQLFVLLAAPGTIKLLEHIGFDTYRDIIDHDIFENTYPNIKLFHDHIEKLISLDWKKIYEEITDRRLYNRSLIVKRVIEKNFIDELKTKILSLI